jgi:outer membrane protein TolC
MNHKTLLLVVFITFCTYASAQERKAISLSSAVDLSISNSKYLQKNAAQIEAATAAVTEAKQRKLPNASVSGSYLKLSAANVDLKVKNNNPSGPPTAIPKVSTAMYGTLNLSLPIYTGGKLKFGIISAELLEKASRLDLENQKEAVINNTIEAYANLFKAAQTVSIVKDNLAQSRQREKEFSDLEKNGLLARNDLLKAQLQSSNLDLALLDAENNLQLAQLNMDILLGLPTDTQLAIDSIGLSFNESAMSIQDYLKAATVNRNDLAANKLRIDAADIAVKSTKAELLPNLSLTGGYIAADIPKVLTVTNAINVGVGVSYNIASLWKNKAKVQQAESQAKQISIQNSIIDDQVTLAVSKNYFDLVSAQKKIQVLQTATEQAKENYRIVNNKYTNSLATLSDLLEADVSNLQANLNYLFAKVDGFVAYNHLLQSAGLLSKSLHK